jgi:hypothetical protein
VQQGSSGCVGRLLQSGSLAGGRAGGAAAACLEGVAASFAPCHRAGDEDSAEFRALVDRHHARYVAALRKLFAEHKHNFAKVGTGLGRPG